MILDSGLRGARFEFPIRHHCLLLTGVSGVVLALCTIRSGTKSS
jgi:hypothetical protein